jgi:two-component system, LuxR family, response regulator FixJ
LKTVKPDQIAIVDDDDAARHALQFLLKVLGHTPISYASAANFLESDIRAFACLILDQHMPGMTGVELAQRLRAEANTIPIMLISGDLTADVVEKAERIGINLISEKPPVLKALSGFIDSALA